MPSAGDRIRASDILVRRGVRVRRAAVQSIASGSPTAISWDTEDEDLGGFITVTSTTVTIPTGLGGIYAITFRAVGTTLTGRGFVEIQPTSAITGMPTEFRNFMDTSNEDRAEVAISIPLLAGDSFVCNVIHGSGANRDFTAWLACYRTGL
jgi:hypothetical protein